MAKNEIIALQKRLEAEFGVGTGEFAQAFLMTKYNAYTRWANGDVVNPPGAALAACRLITLMLDDGYTADEIRASIDSPLK